MKVLLVNDGPTETPGSGGVEVHVRQLRNALEERGVDVSILASQQRGRPSQTTAHERLIPEFKAPPLRKHLLKNHRSHQAALQEARRYIHEFRPDVIHVHNLMDPGALHMLRQCGPIVKSIHDCRPFCVKPLPVVASRLVGDSEQFCEISFGGSCWRRCYAHSGKTPLQRVEAWSYFLPNLRARDEILQVDHLVVYSQYLKDLALHQMPDPQTIHVVHLFTAAEAASLNLPVQSKAKNKPVFLFAGRLSPEKGIFKIFDALDLIPEIACKLVIAGDGPVRDEVIRRIQSAHPQHEIELKGFLDQAHLYQQYQAASVLLFPSIGSEGCPLTGIEAMYFGTPSIAFDTGGVGEWLIPDRTGILLQRGDIPGLARAMKDLAADPGRINRLGGQAQEFVRKKFSREDHITRLLQIYQLAGRTAPRNRERCSL
jgi:glycosyltransferase involved in cell wall biosynthesis